LAFVPLFYSQRKAGKKWIFEAMTILWRFLFLSETFLLVFAQGLTARSRVWTDTRGLMEVTFPAGFSTGNQTVVSSVGSLLFSTASAVGVSGIDFYAYRADINPKLAVLKTAELRARETVKVAAGQLVSLDAIATDDGYGVQFLAMVSGNRRLKGRILVYEGMLVELHVLTDVSRISKPETNAFLDSFRWKKTSREKLRQLLVSTGLTFSADDDNDFKVAYKFTEDKRSQIAFVTTFTSPAHEGKVIEIWSPFYSSNGPLTQAVANQLLAENSRHSLGNFQTLQFDDGKTMAVFSIILDVSVSASKLKEAILHALIQADDQENRLSGKDQF
jgi:hypothetical protein